MESPFEELIVKFISGHISETEKITLSNWIKESPENKKQLDDYQRLWEITRKSLVTTNFETNEEWKKLEAIIETPSSHATRDFKYSKSVILQIAASIALIFVCSIIFYVLTLRENQLIKQTDATKSVVVLADGTRVFLNHHSRLAYPENFDAKERVVKLEGEAFFEVKKDRQMPFRVLLEEAEVVVLGTSFNVKAYPKDTANEIFVVTGKVRVSRKDNNRQEVILNKGEKATHNIASERLFKEKIDDPNFLSWKNEKLSFKGTPLKEVITALSDYYQVEIKVENQRLLNCRFTSEFQSATLPEVIEVLNTVLNLETTSRNGVYYIGGEGC